MRITTSMPGRRIEMMGFMITLSPDTITLRYFRVIQNSGQALPPLLIIRQLASGREHFYARCRKLMRSIDLAPPDHREFYCHISDMAR
jgi:hypothetical protein